MHASRRSSFPLQTGEFVVKLAAAVSESTAAASYLPFLLDQLRDYSGLHGWQDPMTANSHIGALSDILPRCTSATQVVVLDVSLTLTLTRSYTQVILLDTLAALARAEAIGWSRRDQVP